MALAPGIVAALAQIMQMTMTWKLSTWANDQYLLCSDPRNRIRQLCIINLTVVIMHPQQPHTDMRHMVLRN